MVRKLSLTLATLLAALLAACQPTPIVPPAPAAASQLKVAATNSILGDLVQNVAGDRVELFVLVGADGDTHTYEPTPGDSRTLAEADLVFENGLEFESWIDDLYTSSGSKAIRVAASDGIEPLEGGEYHEEAGHNEGGTPEAEEEHGHGEFDPHIWHSVPNAIQMVKNIRAALASADAANAAEYQANTDAFIVRLQELDNYLTTQVNTLPAERRKLITNHDALGYFANAYGFTIVGDALGSVSTEAAEPSAAQIAEVADAIRREGVPVLFTENIEGSQVIEQIAREAGVKVAPALYTDALGPAGSEGATYLTMMRYNVDVIVSALR
ncbi:MAG: metal ABC transporter solute-binding protein, Zn/Mn family [Anaerolineales bacterium]